MYCYTLPAICLALILSFPAMAQNQDKAPGKGQPGNSQGEALVHQKGDASFYGEESRGDKTANGENFNPDKKTAASPYLPLGTHVTVTNTENGKSVDLKINDRGPYTDGRIIDLSKKAAEKLDMKKDGVADVTVEARPSSQTTEKLKDEIGDKAEAERELRHKQK